VVSEVYERIPIAPTMYPFPHGHLRGGIDRYWTLWHFPPQPSLVVDSTPESEFDAVIYLWHLFTSQTQWGQYPSRSDDRLSPGLVVPLLLSLWLPLGTSRVSAYPLVPNSRNLSQDSIF
jgi:hypothetical protein